MDILRNNHGMLKMLPQLKLTTASGANQATTLDPLAHPTFHHNNIVQINEWKGSKSCSKDPQYSQEFMSNPRINPETSRQLRKIDTTKGRINFKFIPTPDLTSLIPSSIAPLTSNDIHNLTKQVKHLIIKFCNCYYLASEKIDSFKAISAIYSHDCSYETTTQEKLIQNMHKHHLLNNNQFTLYFTPDTTLDQKFAILKQLDVFLLDELSKTWQPEQIQQFLPTIENFYSDYRLPATCLVSLRNEYASEDFRINLEHFATDNLLSFANKKDDNDFINYLKAEQFNISGSILFDVEVKQKFNTAVSTHVRLQTQQRLTNKFCYTFIKKYNEGKHNELVVASLNRIMAQLIKLNPEHKAILKNNLVKVGDDFTQYYLKELKVNDSMRQHAFAQTQAFICTLAADTHVKLLEALTQVHQAEVELASPTTSIKTRDNTFKQLNQAFTSIFHTLLNATKSNLVAQKQLDALMIIMKQSKQDKTKPTTPRQVDYIKKLFDELEETPEIANEF
jgi:hypothetical protein